VKVTSDYVAALRNTLTGEDDSPGLVERLQARDGTDHSGRIFILLAAAALRCALRKRFPNGYTDADVVKLVGHARSRLGEDGYEIDPLTAEGTVRGLLGDMAAFAHLEGQATATAIFPLLLELLDQEGITEDRIDDFLAEAVTIAETWPEPEQAGHKPK
jgi:hypothetical protein